MLMCSGLYDTDSRTFWMRRSSPTSTHSIAVASEARATPFTTSSGAKSPPIASTAITGMPRPPRARASEHYRRRPALPRPSASARSTRQPPPQRRRVDAVLERLATVDDEHRNLAAVGRLERGIATDVD